MALLAALFDPVSSHYFLAVKWKHPLSCFLVDSVALLQYLCRDPQLLLNKLCVGRLQCKHLRFQSWNHTELQLQSKVIKAKVKRNYIQFNKMFLWPNQGMLAPLCFTWKLIILFFFSFVSDCWSGLPLLHPEEHSQPQRADTSHRGPQWDLLQQGDCARVLQLHGETVVTFVCFCRPLQFIISERQPRTIAAHPRRQHPALLFICSRHQLLGDPFSVATWNTQLALRGRRF